ncbi:hypothetical protein QMA10_16665 [Arthrobacter sp. APC 3897]|uniref:hypothetical protein n=1 Tax=Arthrobacter sp. APC 3897 TaxID=3035204 RepID=UPI0025B4C089|nr:hypothetical protein [Arthrobacter sp. APC 3897]MDN3483545.1 hypothetical protein [Arthrobacter sp. APC 3897]
MSQDNTAPTRQAFAALVIALAAVATALSAVAADSLPFRIILIVSALLLLAGAGAFIALAMGRLRPLDPEA